MTAELTTDLPFPGLAGVPRAESPQTRKDFASDQEVRWCPGCGDYAVLAAVQSFLPRLGLRRENIVFVSGIGCSSRFPYYLDTYGMHSIHGRAPAIATGLAAQRPDLSVWVVTGDGDGLSIGGNHLIHALRRNVNLTILLFNNKIYGLTKGQYSPTSELGKVTKSTPMGSVDAPLDPVRLALGAEATFVARTIDSDRQHLTEVLAAAAAHPGAALVEILQNCPVFNDGAWDGLKGAEASANSVIRLREGEEVRFGPPGEDGLGSRAVVRGARVGELRIVDTVGPEDEVVTHDPAAPDAGVAFALAGLGAGAAAQRVTPVGVFRKVLRPTYDEQLRAQSRAAGRGEGDREAAFEALLHAGDTWTVG